MFGGQLKLNIRLKYTDIFLELRENVENKRQNLNIKLKHFLIIK